MKKIKSILTVLIILHLSYSAVRAYTPAGNSPADRLWLTGKWKARDVAAGSDFYVADKDGKIPQLKLKLEVKSQHLGTHRITSCTVIDESGSDRAVTLAFSIPYDASGGTWWDNPHKSRSIERGKTYSNLVDIGFGADGVASRYPLSVITLKDTALCLAVTPEPARFVRYVYDGSKKQIRAEFDFGLSRLPKNFPSRADAGVVGLTIPQKWAFRRALARYYDLFPEVFKWRVKEGGIWMPFAPLDIVEKPEDFGFAFREVAYQDIASVKTDEKLGVDSYVYVEPQTNWREFKGDGERTYEAFVSQLWDDALKGDRRAQATLTSGVEREDGRYDLYLGPVTFTKLTPFGVNCDPTVPTGNWGKWPNKAQYEMELLEKVLGWSTDPPNGLEGIYIDSMEGWGILGNYNRSHWKTTRWPLTFDPATHNVCLMNFWSTYAFTQQLSERLHRNGMLLMGNDVYYRFWFLAPYVDIAGREYRWLENGKFIPLSDDQYLFIRSMCARRPYLMLMNNDYEDGSRIEEYFQRSLFYAVYPSMFHGHSRIGETAYFYNPKWYNRDRHLFKKYIPLIRKLDFAGWEPVPFAETIPTGIRIERYGNWKSKDLSFTLHNPTAKAQKVDLILYRRDLGLPENFAATGLINNKQLTVTKDGDKPQVHIDLLPNGYAAVEIR